jgi:hypothetical protein
MRQLLDPHALYLTLPFSVLLLVAPGSMANSMRCGESLIERGYTFFEVLERCGEPDLRYDWDEVYVPGVTSRLTEWVYEQGPNRFRRVLTFDKGRLERIELRRKPEVPLESID